MHHLKKKKKHWSVQNAEWRFNMLRDNYRNLGFSSTEKCHLQPRTHGMFTSRPVFGLIQDRMPLNGARDVLVHPGVGLLSVFTFANETQQGLIQMDLNTMYMPSL